MHKWLIIALIVVLAGCSPAAPPTIDLSQPAAEFCMTAAGLQAELDKAFQTGQLAGCKADIILNNPTYAELQQFLKDNQALIKCEGNCVDHTRDLSEAAYNAGWSMYVVLLNAEETGTGHVIGAFATKDKGIVFIEPQTLWEVKVAIGQDYALNFKEHNWQFPQFTIKQIGIIR